MDGTSDAGVFGARRASFGAYAATYDAVRPEWPTATVAWMLGSPTPATVCRVVDLGAGTGLGTRAIAAMGHDVLAVEPSDGMRHALTESLEALTEPIARRISTLSGGAEDIPVAAASVDAVTVFQAWHWFDEPVAAGECARVLLPGGWLSMAWHQRSEELAWLRELSVIVEHHENVHESQPAPGLGPDFERPERTVFTYRMRQSVEDLVRHASTWSYVAIHDDRDRILDDVRALGQQVADGEGMVEIPMNTLCYRLRRR